MAYLNLSDHCIFPGVPNFDVIVNASSDDLCGILGELNSCHLIVVVQGCHSLSSPGVPNFNLTIISS